MYFKIYRRLYVNGFGVSETDFNIFPYMVLRESRETEDTLCFELSAVYSIFKYFAKNCLSFFLLKQTFIDGIVLLTVPFLSSYPERNKICRSCVYSDYYSNKYLIYI